MSGFEIVGLVFGAIPIAISALEKYEKLARRLGLFFKIRLEHKKCHDRLRYFQLALTRHLRQLILPLVADDDLAEQLFSNPGGDEWKDPSISGLLEQRLQESYVLYLDYIRGMNRTMGELNQDLLIDSKGVLEQLSRDEGESGTSRLKKAAATSESRVFQLYRLKFSNNEVRRNRLFADLDEYCNKLERLLDSSDKDTELVQQRSALKQTMAIDVAVCNFWINASKLFRALATSWNCCCHEQHCAQLQLQHRTNVAPDFRIAFGAPVSSSWELRNTRISADLNNGAATSQVLDSVPIRQLPRHQTSGAKKTTAGREGGVNLSSQATTYVTMTATRRGSTSSSTVLPPTTAHSQLISDLCASLGHANGPCYGYVTGKDCQFLIFKDCDAIDVQSKTVTLEQVLQREAGASLSRQERYSLSLVLASSVLQLLDSPWLPRPLKKSKVLFSSDPDKTDRYRLDRPHVRRSFAGLGVDSMESSFNQSLDHLGIILLELCFGDVLANQRYRRNWPTGENDMTRAAFDVMAARDWQCEVIEEAGPDYSEAVAWCLGGNRSVPPDQWRQEMLQKVVQPLQRCVDYLTKRP